MEWIETTGKSIEEAKEAALDELGVDEQDAEFEVLAEPRAGLFGRMRGEARVRSRVRPTAPRPKDDRRSRRRGRGSEQGSGAGGASGGASAVATAEAPAGREDGAGDAGGGDGARRRRSRGGRSRGGGGGGHANPPGQGGGSSGAGPASGASGAASRAGGGAGGGSGIDGGGVSSRTSEGGASRGGAGGRVRTHHGREARRGIEDLDEEDYTMGDLEVPLEEQGQVASAFLAGLIEAFGLTAEITATPDDDDIVRVAITGPDLGLLIGPKGATLLALQDLTRSAVQQKTRARNGRINVDVSGYRKKRAEALARFALQVADGVRSSGARRALEPMNAVDRKVVHDTLTGVDGVDTFSEGEDPRRYVVVAPAPAPAPEPA